MLKSTLWLPQMLRLKPKLQLLLGLRLQPKLRVNPKLPPLPRSIEAFSASRILKAQPHVNSHIAQRHDNIQAVPSEQNSKCGQRGSCLSGSQQERLVTTRALLQQP